MKIKNILGGVEGLEKQIEEEEVAEKNEEERRQRISNKTRNRLSQLLNLTKTKKNSQTR